MHVSLSLRFSLYSQKTEDQVQLVSDFFSLSFFFLLIQSRMLATQTLGKLFIKSSRFVVIMRV